jgi:hypothetical protein
MYLFFDNQEEHVGDDASRCPLVRMNKRVVDNCEQKLLISFVSVL